MTFGFIKAEKASFPISRMCRVLGVSQSGFFAWKNRPACRRQQQDMIYLAHIRTAFALSNGTYGRQSRASSTIWRSRSAAGTTLRIVPTPCPAYSAISSSAPEVCRIGESVL